MQICAARCLFDGRENMSTLIFIFHSVNCKQMKSSSSSLFVHSSSSPFVVVGGSGSEKQLKNHCLTNAVSEALIFVEVKTISMPFQDSLSRPFLSIPLSFSMFFMSSFISSFTTDEFSGNVLNDNNHNNMFSLFHSHHSPNSTHTHSQMNGLRNDTLSPSTQTHTKNNNEPSPNHHTFTRLDILSRFKLCMRYDLKSIY